MRKLTYEYCDHINEKMDKFEQLLSRYNTTDKNHSGIGLYQNKKSNMDKSVYKKRLIGK